MEKDGISNKGNTNPYLNIPKEFNGAVAAATAVFPGTDSSSTQLSPEELASLHSQAEAEGGVPKKQAFLADPILGATADRLGIALNNLMTVEELNGLMMNFPNPVPKHNPWDSLAGKSSLIRNTLKAANWIKKTFVGFTKEDHISRNCALGNELAESLHGSIPQIMFQGLWAVTLFYTPVRALTHGLMNNSVVAGARKLIHDALAAVSIPTLVVRALNSAQNWIFEKLGIKKDGAIAKTVRPIISFSSVKKLMNKVLDPMADKALHHVFSLDSVKTFGEKVDLKFNNLLLKLGESIAGKKQSATASSVAAPDQMH